VKTLIQSIDQPESNIKSNAVMPLRLKSQEIFKQQNNVVIEHEGEEYHLKLTKQNKLILTK
jgi:hemin uptake protein HemP